MITAYSDTQYYLYRHIRKDNDMPFYIGIGKKGNSFKTFETEYKRAFSFKSRTLRWFNIVNKHGYEIEILYECDNTDEIVKKEIEFIYLHKRKEFGGILVNSTDGGDGCVGLKHSDITKKRLSEINKGKALTKETIEKIVSKIKGAKRTDQQKLNQSELSFKLFKNKHPAEKLKDTEVLDIINMSNSGIRGDVIIKKYSSVSETCIYNILAKKAWKKYSHLLLRQPRINLQKSDIDETEIINGYINGYSIVELSSKLNIDRKRISKILKNNDIEVYVRNLRKND